MLEKTRMLLTLINVHKYIDICVSILLNKDLFSILVYVRTPPDNIFRGTKSKSTGYGIITRKVKSLKKDIKSF